MSNTYKFDLPSHHKSIIKVIGVGGGGSNAVTHMFNQGIKDVEFVICNSDVQALKSSPVPNKLQIGVHLTEGLGAGANPEVGMNAALESKEDIRNLLSNDTKMVFITAGMGGGTGTGAAPVIANVARELGVLCVGIVTAPFMFEGRRKGDYAQLGIDQLKEFCDTVLVISNDKLREVYGNLTIREAFSKADNVLTTAAKSIAEIITETSQVNVDFQDVKTIMRNSGPAVMGSAVAEGDNRARKAVEEAISSPLLDNTDVRGAEKILLSIMYGDDQELTMDELSDITDFIEDKVGCSPENLIFGQGNDSELGKAIRVTVVATGFNTSTQEERATKVYDLNTGRAVEKTPPAEPTRTEPSTFSYERNTVRNQPVQEDEKKVIFEKNEEADKAAENEQPTAENDSKVIFKIDGDYEIQDVSTQENTPESQQPEEKVERTMSAEDLHEKRRVLNKQAEERAKRLKGNDGFQNMDPHEFKEKLEIPAYKRRNIPLRDVPHSSENEMSRYNLNDDDDILGDNKFLHDNVD